MNDGGCRALCCPDVDRLCNFFICCPGPLGSLNMPIDRVGTAGDRGNPYGNQFLDLKKESLRPRREGELRESKEGKGVNRQREQSAEEALKEWLVYREVGPKKNSKGYKENWIGYKLQTGYL